jgi:hypothetical protein
VFLAGLFLLTFSQLAGAADRPLRVTQALVDYTAKTVTISVSGLDDAKHLGAPKVRMAGSPLVVASSAVNSGGHSGEVIANLPSPIPTGSFLLEVAWGKDRDDKEHTFSLALGLVGPQGPPGPQGLQGIQGVQGPQGLQGPQGIQGPAGSSAGGPPFVFICTPAFLPQTGGGSGPRSDLYVFNGSSSPANVAVHFLDVSGTNLAGVTIPSSSPPTPYPGQTGTNTVPVASLNTLIVTWVLTTDSPDLAPNVSTAIQVISDQPVAVSTDIQFSGFHPLPCSLLPK